MTLTTLFPLPFEDEPQPETENVSVKVVEARAPGSKIHLLHTIAVLEEAVAALGQELHAEREANARLRELMGTEPDVVPSTLH